jgi:hypothetical protein
LSTLRIPTARIFEPLLRRSRYKGAYGGRGSGKLLVWDKVLGLGTTDPLAGFASVTSNLVVSFYFAKRGFENVARIIKRTGANPSGANPSNESAIIPMTGCCLPYIIAAVVVFYFLLRICGDGLSV